MLVSTAPPVFAANGKLLLVSVVVCSMHEQDFTGMPRQCTLLLGQPSTILAQMFRGSMLTHTHTQAGNARVTGAQPAHVF